MQRAFRAHLRLRFKFLLPAKYLPKAIAVGYNIRMAEEGKKRRALIGVAIAAYIVCLGLVIFEMAGGEALFGGEPPAAFTLGMSASERLLLAAAFACLAGVAGYGRLFMPHIKGGVIAFVAAMALALANFPFFTLASGELTYTAGAGLTALYLVNCVAIGLFEESAFRGLLLPLLFGLMKGKRYAGLLATVAQSAVFALFHIFNLFAGAGFGATMMQVGYTFLMGCLFGALTLLTRSVVPSMIAHAVYDVGGTMVTYGVASGANWDTPSIVVMAVVSSLAGLYLFIAVFRRTWRDPFEL